MVKQGKAPLRLRYCKMHERRAVSLRKRAAQSSSPDNLLAQARGEERAAARQFALWRAKNPTAPNPFSTIVDMLR